MTNEANNYWPFQAWLRLAVTQMHLSPAEFWAMDVCDWLNLYQTPQAPRLSSDEFEALMSSYPDREVENESE